MLRRQFAIVLLLLGSCLGGLRADEIALVSVGETWRLFPAVNEPPAAWRENEFNDSEWLTGESGFGLSTWGENTTLTGLQRGSGTVYFRKAFTVDDLAAIRSLTLRCDWQGGFVAFLNGVEFARRGFAGPPGTLVPFDAGSAPRYAGSAEEIPLPDPALWLKSGTNLLAFQAHPAAGVALDVVLVPELLANFTRGPYLQNVGLDRATVLWRTPVPLAGRVEFGPTEELGQTVLATTESPVQEVRLTGLQPGTRYFYRVVAGSGDAAARAPVFSFRTLPATGDLDVVLFGDSGAGSAPQFRVAKLLLARTPNLIMHLGDVIYPYFTGGQTDTRFLSVYRGLLRTTASFFAWGNHDLYAGVEPFLTAIRSPTNNVSAADHLADGTRPEFYYSFDAGDAHFAVLFAPYFSQYYMREGCPQLRWLEADLAASKKPWKFLCVHHPVNTSGAHRWDDYNYNKIADRQELFDRLMPLAAKYGVQMIFSGHDHNFERFQPINRTHTVVTGGGGIILYGLGQRDPNSAVFNPTWHYSELQLRGDTLRLTATDWQGNLFDALEFRRTPADSADPDGDGLGPVAELAAGTRPDSPDTDGDGLSDGWEFLHGLDPLHREAADVPEKLAAFLAAPLPRPLTELAARNLPNGRLQLRWLGAVGYRTLVESAAYAGAPWEPLPEFPTPRSLADDPQLLDLPADAATRFFRVRLVAE